MSKAPNSHKSWKSQISKLENMAPHFPVIVIAQTLGRTELAIKEEAKKQDISLSKK